MTGKYIRPDLVCFDCFGDSAIMRDRGLVIEQGQLDFFSVSVSHPLPVFSGFLVLFPSASAPFINKLKNYSKMKQYFSQAYNMNCTSCFYFEGNISL